MFSNNIRNALLQSLSASMDQRGKHSKYKRKKFERHPSGSSLSNDSAPDLVTTSTSNEINECCTSYEIDDDGNDLEIPNEIDIAEEIEGSVDDLASLFETAFMEENDQYSDDDKEAGAIGEDYFWKFANQHSALTVTEAATLIISLQRKFRISDAAMDAMIKLFIALFKKPNEDVAFSSFRKAKRIVQDSMVRKCGRVMSPIQTICETCFSTIIGKACSNIRCQKIGDRQTTARYFTCSIERQVSVLVSDNIDLILSNLEKAKRVAASGTVSDVVNGTLYQSFGDNPVDGTLTISLIVNTDGARPLYASTGQLWPCVAVIAELPPKIRYAFANCIVMAMWHSNHKPNWKLFLEDPLLELEHLQEHGFICRINKRITKIKVRILATVFDLPARASILEHNQWNGNFGCMDCLDPGKRDKDNGIFYWPFAFSAPEKTSKWYVDIYCRFKSFKAERSNNKEPLMGVKDESVLTKFIDFGQKNPYDVMHQSYRGVVDRILIAFLTPARRGHKKAWKIGDKGFDFKRLDHLQLQINFPHDFQRTVLSLDRWKQSKAIEYKNIILYTLIPTSKKILSARGNDAIDFWHWVLLYNDICRRLSQDEICLDDLPSLERLIECWQLLVSKFLGEFNSTFNIHATRHMPKYVRLLGPVQNYSAFAFEGFNGLFVRFVTSAFGSLNQIADRLALQQYCGRWIASTKTKNTSASAFIGILEEHQPFQQIIDHLYVMDEVKIIVTNQVINQNNLAIHECKAFARARNGIATLHSLAYKKRKNTCSYIAHFTLNGTAIFGIIHQFLVNGCDVFAYVQLYEVISENISSDLAPSDRHLKKLWQESLYGSFFKTVKTSENYMLIHLKNFKNLCIVVKVDEVTYLTDLAHNYEHN